MALRWLKNIKTKLRCFNKNQRCNEDIVDDMEDFIQDGKNLHLKMY